jgi:hypothetical protein
VIFTGSTSKTDIGLGNVDNTSDANKQVSTATLTALNLKANLASPTFTGTVSGITKAMVGLGSVDNTSDASKPVSTATQTALDLKANIASPTFTGTVSGVTKSMVGLGLVDNTTDAAKPISTATQTALDAKQATLNGTGFVKSTAGTISYDNSTYLSSSTAASTYLPINNPTATGTLTAPTISNSLGANFATSSGNVGIGTASPAYKLDVNGSFNANSIYTNDNQSGYAGNYGRYSVAYPYATFSTSGAWGYDWQINGFPKMRMFSNGSVGINTTTDAGYLLDVNGAARVTGTTQFNGNVGIGAAPSTQSLNVYSTTNDIAFQAINGKTTGSNYAVAGTAVGVGGTINMGGYFYADGAASNHGIRVYNITAATNNYALFIDSPAKSYFQGNLQIGTTVDTGEKLQVNGTANITGMANFGSIYVLNNTINVANANDTDANELYLNYYGYNAGNTRFRNTIIGNGKGVPIIYTIGSSGNVNIGRGNNFDSGYKLDVLGTIQSSQFKLNALNTAPANATATGTVGEIRVDASYIYICTATNTWKRSAITTW